MKPSGCFFIGLTGNIGCGKTTVLRMLTELGAHTIDADAVTRQVQAPGTPVYSQIVAAFGPDVAVKPGGPLDRKRLATQVFAHPAELQRLESIVHPAVHEALEDWLQRVQTNPAYRTEGSPLPIAVLDAIRLVETGWRERADAAWVVVCQPEQQIARLRASRGMTEEEISHRVAAQLSQPTLMAQADVVIDNSGTLEQTRQLVDLNWNKLLVELTTRV